MFELLPSSTMEAIQHRTLRYGTTYISSRGWGMEHPTLHLQHSSGGKKRMAHWNDEVPKTRDCIVQIVSQYLMPHRGGKVHPQDVR